MLRCPRVMLTIAGALILTSAALIAVALILHKPSDEVSATSTISSSPGQTGWPFHRLPPQVQLTDAAGARTSLAALRGKVIVLAPSLTLCHEICPLTTGAFMNMRRQLARQGLGDRVAFVETTVDPWRDSPARLRAYDRLTGANFIQLTGTLAQIRRFWNFFGIGFRRVPQGNPPDIDWWTHKPETFDVEHTDGVFLIDVHGYERDFFPGYANVKGQLSKTLRRLLSKVGEANLQHPVGTWTEPQVMAGTDRLLGRPFSST